jgi:hypothetical protein
LKKLNANSRNIPALMMTRLQRPYAGRECSMIIFSLHVGGRTRSFHDGHGPGGRGA